MSPLEKVQADALKLSSKERAFLAKCLIESLDQGEEQEIERLWLDEAERRLAAYREGTIPARAASEVFAEARSLSLVARQAGGMSLDCRGAEEPAYRIRTEADG